MIIHKIESKTAQRKKCVAAYARVNTEAEEQQESLRTQIDYYIAFIQQNPMWEYFSVLAAVAQEESRSISENVKRSYRKHAEKGIRHIGSNRVLGYDEVDGVLMPNKDAWIVKLIFHNYTNGASVGQIIRALSEKGAKRVRSDKPFTPSAIFAILDNELYVGDRLLQKAAPYNYLTKRPDITQSYSSYYITDDHEAIIDREMWELVKNRRVRVKDSRLDGIFMNETSHFLYGIVFCGNCGVPYKRRTIRGKGSKSYKAWDCGDRLLGAKGNGCKNQIILEESLLRQISERIGLTWNGVEAFDVETFRQMVTDMEITESGVRVKRMKSA